MTNERQLTRRFPVPRVKSRPRERSWLAPLPIAPPHGRAKPGVTRRTRTARESPLRRKASRRWTQVRSISATSTGILATELLTTFLGSGSPAAAHRQPSALAPLFLVRRPTSILCQAPRHLRQERAELLALPFRSSSLSVSQQRRRSAGRMALQHRVTPPTVMATAHTTGSSTRRSRLLPAATVVGLTPHSLAW